MSVLAVLLLGLAVLEVFLTVLVRRLRRGFQWLITEADERPVLDPEALRKYLDGSFDPDLGWVRKPDTEGREKGAGGEVVFHIDSSGARAAPGGKDAPAAAAFGDSYVFCRQVADEETWEAQTARISGLGVMNFGVGNYGADQALLRYERTELPPSVRVAILGFVPETICRVQSYWKHYLEFGNTFAFKPRFLPDGAAGLVLKPQAMRRAEDFTRIEEKLPGIRAADGFYRRKFRSRQFRFPYLFSFLRHPGTNARLIAALVRRAVLRRLGRSGPEAENRPFELIMRENLKDARRMYADPDATALLRGILLRFAAAARRRGHVPVVLVMPQLLDLRGGGATPEYCAFFAGLGREMAVLEMTDVLTRQDLETLYVEDAYGGHFSVEGNRLVAETVAAFLRGCAADEAREGAP